MRHLLLVLLFACAAPSHEARTSLPTAEALHEWLRAPLSARVALCTSARGEITDVRLARGSGDAHFDHAVVVDARHWRLAPGVPACRTTLVTYVP